MLTKLILPGEKIELQSMEKSILGSASDKKSYISIMIRKILITLISILVIKKMITM